MLYTLYGNLLWIVYITGCIGGGYNAGDILGRMVTKSEIPLKRVLNVIAASIIMIITTYIHSKYY